MATWPTSVPTDANLYIAVNELQSNLSSGINAAVVTVTINSTTSFPTVGLVLIDNEIIKYTGVSGSDLTGCTRGFDGTTAATHSAAAVVSFAICANHHNVLKDEVKAICQYLSDNLGTGSAPLTASRALVSNGSGKIIVATVTSTELGFLSGVTSAIQTQINGKEPSITTLSVAKGGTNSGTGLNSNRNIVSSGGAIVESAAITASRALVSDVNGLPVHATTTAAEIGFVNGLTSAVQTQLNNIAAGTIGRNRIVNAEMRIDQANVGAAVTVGASGVYGPDMFRAQGIAAAGVYTFQQSTTTPPTGFTHFVRSTCTTADAAIAASDLYAYRHFIEGNNVRDLLLGSASAKAVTLSFWVRSSLTGTYCVAFSNNANDRSYVAEYTINSANTWEQKTITLTGDVTGTWVTDTGCGIEVRWTLAGGSTFQTSANAWAAGNFYCTSNQVNFMSSNVTRTHDVTGVQLELGSVATPFEYRPYAVELLMAKRYFQKLGGIQVDEPLGVLQCFSTTQAQGVFICPVELRALPTISVVGSVGDFRVYNAAAVAQTATAVSGGSLGTKAFFISGTVASGLVAGNASNMYDHTTTSYFSIDARF